LPSTPGTEEDELPPAFEACEEYSTAINATQCPLRYWATGLPPGLYVDPVTGVIQGTPLGIEPPFDQPPGTPVIFDNVVLHASNERGVGTKRMRMRVYPQVQPAFSEPTNVATAIVGQNFIWRINFREDAPYLWSLAPPIATGGRTPGLPATLQPLLSVGCDGNAYGPLNPVIAGTPTTPGFYRFRILASNYCGSTGMDFFLNVVSADKAVDRVTESYGQVFTMSGADSWHPDDLEGVNGGFAMVSPVFDQNPLETTRRTATMSTRVTGPATVSFCWRSQTSSVDSGRFMVNGSSLATISGVNPPLSGSSQGWIKESYPIPAGESVVAWVYDNYDSDEHALDHVWVDDIRVTYPNLLAALDNPATSGITVTSSGSSGNTGAPAAWRPTGTIKYFGATSAMSGPIPDANPPIPQTSSMEVTLPGPGTVSFRWRVHTGPSTDDGVGDFLVLYIDGARSTALTGVSGWVEKTVGFDAPGPHILRFAYEKDNIPFPDTYLWGDDREPGTIDDIRDNGPDGQPGTGDDQKDKAWVDHLVFTPAPAVVSPAAASARLASQARPASTAVAVSAGASSFTDTRFDVTLDQGARIYTYQVDTARAGVPTPQTSADGVTWRNATAIITRVEGALRTFEVRGAANDPAFNHFRLN
jgi:hypothetical protein